MNEQELEIKGFDLSYIEDNSFVPYESDAGASHLNLELTIIWYEHRLQEKNRSKLVLTKIMSLVDDFPKTIHGF